MTPSVPTNSGFLYRSIILIQSYTKLFVSANFSYDFFRSDVIFFQRYPKEGRFRSFQDKIYKKNPCRLFNQGKDFLSKNSLDTEGAIRLHRPIPNHLRPNYPNIRPCQKGNLPIQISFRDNILICQSPKSVCKAYGDCDTV